MTTASEQLRELSDALLVGDWKAVRPLREALPHLVEIVKAAEMFIEEAGGIHNPEYPTRLRSYHTAHHALVVLRDSLEGVGR